MSIGRKDSKDKKREYERAVFKDFLSAHPTFASRVQDIAPREEDSHVDVSTRLVDGTRVDWQLEEWLDENQMKAAKHTERLEADILNAIGEQGPNKTRHIRHCALSFNEDVGRFDTKDGPMFRAECFRVIGDVDSSWQRNPSWHSQQGYRCTAFEAYPTLGKYLAGIHFDPHNEWPSSQPWIHFEAWGGPCDPRVAIAALKQAIKKKAAHYGRFGNEDVRLIVFYHQAILYNTPFDGRQVDTFEDLASIAKETLSRIAVPFKKVYLLNALGPVPEAFEVYPTVRRCD